MEETNNEESIVNGEVAVDPTENKKKKFIMYGIGILITLLCIAGGFFYFFKYKSQPEAISSTADVDNKTKTENEKQLIFYDLAEFVVNLNKVNNQTNFLKVSITFQLKNANDTAKIEEHLPIIKDAFQIYLRELKPEDIQGSAGIFLLKQELLLRINKILYPIKIEDVLFRDLLVQ